MFQCKWSDRSSQEERAKFNAEISYLRSLKWISKADQSTLFSQKFVSRLNLQLPADFWTKGWNYDIPNESDFTSIDNLIFSNPLSISSISSSVHSPAPVPQKYHRSTDNKKVLYDKQIVQLMTPMLSENPLSISSISSPKYLPTFDLQFGRKRILMIS